MLFSRGSLFFSSSAQIQLFESNVAAEYHIFDCIPTGSPQCSMLNPGSYGCICKNTQSVLYSQEGLYIFFPSSSFST